MNTYDCRIVHGTWAAIEPARDLVVERFHQRLFEIAPTLRLLLRDADLAALGRGLLHALDVAVANVDRLERAVGVVARRAVNDPVATALLWAIERTLGPLVWTPAVAAAWEQCCALIARSQELAAAASQQPQARVA